MMEAMANIIKPIKPVKIETKATIIPKDIFMRDEYEIREIFFATNLPTSKVI